MTSLEPGGLPLSWHPRSAVQGQEVQGTFQPLSGGAEPRDFCPTSPLSALENVPATSRFLASRSIVYSRSDLMNDAPPNKACSPSLVLDFVNLLYILATIPTNFLLLVRNYPFAERIANRLPTTTRYRDPRPCPSEGASDLPQRPFDCINKTRAEARCWRTAAGGLITSQ